MQPHGRSVIEMGVAVHRLVEATLKGTRSMTKKQPTTAKEEAKRLRIESAARESRQFGTKTAAAITDTDSQYMSDESVIDNGPGGTFKLHPEVQEQLNSVGSSRTGYSIMEEIHSDRQAGKLRPFVEGEPIGTIKYHERKAAKPLMSAAQIKEEERAALRERQRRNDAKLAKLARR